MPIESKYTSPVPVTVAQALAAKAAAEAERDRRVEAEAPLPQLAPGAGGRTAGRRTASPAR